MIKEKPAAILNFEQGVGGHTPVATFIVLAILKDADERGMSYDQIVKAAGNMIARYVCDETLEVRYGKHRLGGVSYSEYVKFIHNTHEELALALQQLDGKGLAECKRMQ